MHTYVDFLVTFGGYKSEDLYKNFENEYLPKLSELNKEGRKYDSDTHARIKSIFIDNFFEVAKSFDIDTLQSVKEIIAEVERLWEEELILINKLRKNAEKSETALNQASNSKNPDYKKIERLKIEKNEANQAFSDELEFISRYRKIYELATIAKKIDRVDNQTILFKGLYLSSSDSLKEQKQMIEKIILAFKG